MLQGKNATETKNCDVEGDNFIMSFIWYETAVQTKDLKPYNIEEYILEQLKCSDLRSLKNRFKGGFFGCLEIFHSDNEFVTNCWC
jgi:hypothetical protein